MIASPLVISLTRQTDLTVASVATVCGDSVHPLSFGGVKPLNEGDPIPALTRHHARRFVYCAQCAAVQEGHAKPGDDFASLK